MSDFPGWASPGDSPGDQPAAAPPPAAPPPPPGQPQWGQPQWGQPQPAGWGTPPQWGQQQPGWAGWTGAPAAARPGVIPLRPLGVGEILDGAITTIRRYPRATLGLSAVVVTISQVIQFFATRSFADAVSTGEFNGTGLTGLALGLIFGLVSGVLLTGALTVVMGQAVLGKPISLAEAWEAVWARFWALIGTSLLVALLSVLALVLCILPFFWAWPALSLATPALMLERQTVWRSIKRSVGLVRGQFWRCLGVVVLAAIITAFLESALSIPFSLLGGGLTVFTTAPDTTADLPTSYFVMTTIGAIVAGTVTAPFSAGVSALLYVDRRMRAEGLDVALAAAAAGATDVPTAPPAAG